MPATVYSRDEMNMLLASALPDQLAVYSIETQSGSWSGHVVHIVNGCGQEAYADNQHFDEPDLPLRRAMSMAKQLCGERWWPKPILWVKD